ncbi:MAG: pilin [Candidatus Nealsonbacteria bacterium]
MRKLFKFILIFSFLFLFCKSQVLAQDACSSGPCCDTSVSPTEFRPSNYVCDAWTEYKCDEQGSAVKREATKYCSSNGADCTGFTSFGDWLPADDRNKCEICIDGLLSPENEAVNVPIPVSLDWCDVGNAQSYYGRILKGGGVYHTFGSLESRIEFDIGYLWVFAATTTYQWEIAACSNEDLTSCGLSCGNEESAVDCADFSPRWSFTTEEKEITPPELINPFYDPGPPEKVPVVSLFDSLEWIGPEEETYWARSFLYEIKKNDTIIIGPILTTSYEAPLADVWSFLETDTKYGWHVKSCLREDGISCSDFGETWFFKTTGAISGDINIDNEIIPVNFDWNDVVGAASYNYQVCSESSFADDKIVDSGIVGSSEVSVDYPTLIQDTQYWFRVRICGDATGEVCGDWSSPESFTTFTLNIPSNPSPDNGGTFYTYENRVSWNSVLGAKFYQYKIDYALKSPEEDDQNCIAGQAAIQLTIVSSNSDFVSLSCLGDYNWWVRACLDKDCEEAGMWRESPWSFTYVQPVPPGQFGLVPCGRSSDNPKTPWNEREPCQFKHVFLLFKNILDFILWRIGLIALVILTIATFVVSYFSMGAPGTVINIRSIWKSAGQGYAIIFLAWTIINTILRVLGFTEKWWTITF